MKKYIVIFLSAILCMVFFANCAPSESVLQTAIASTKEIDDAILEETRVALQAATQEALSIQSTQEFEIGQTKTVEALSVAQTQAAIPKNCTPGGTYVDFEGDIDIDYLDIIKVETSLEKEVLTVIFYLKSLPNEITINKEELEEGMSEYYWGVSIDVDNDPDTGAFRSIAGEFSGSDYELSLFHFVSGRPKTGKLDEVMKSDAYVWRAKEDYTEMYKHADLKVDYEQNTITLSGGIPKIDENSLLHFVTQESYGFAPDSDLLCVE